MCFEKVNEESAQNYATYLSKGSFGSNKIYKTKESCINEKDMSYANLSAKTVRKPNPNDFFKQELFEDKINEYNVVSEEDVTLEITKKICKAQ